jgi:hypothetical protein
MTESGINKMEAAQRPLDCAIRLLEMEEDSLAIHTLAYAAFRVLFDLCPNRHAMRFALDTIIETMGWDKLTHVPNFLKHADRDPDAFLAEHSDKSAHITLLFAVLLDAANGGEETPYMRSFVKLDDPYMEGYKLKKIVEYFSAHRNEPRFRQGSHPLSDEDKARLRTELTPILTAPST